MRWWPARRKQAAPPTALTSVADPALAEMFSFGAQDNFSGVYVSEMGIMGLSGVYRGVKLLSDTLGTAPLNTYQDSGTGERRPSTSIFDAPDGPDGLTPFEWKRQLVVHLKIHGNIFLLKHRTAAGAVARYEPIHPLRVAMIDPTLEQIRRGPMPRGGSWFDVRMDDMSLQRFDANDVLHIPGTQLAGKRGLSLVQIARNSMGTALAGDRAAARAFKNGAMISGIVSPESDVDGFDATGIRKELNNSVTGYENAGTLAVINRVLKFQPWTMTLADAQFLQSRQFSIEEQARWLGVPPHLLMQVDKQTSWGTGVEEQNRALAKSVLGPDAQLIAERCSRDFSPSTRFVEFDFAGLERSSPEKEISMLTDQWDADMLTLNEIRRYRNMPPIPGGNVVKSRWMKAAEPEPAPVEPAPDPDPDVEGDDDDQPAD